MVKRCEHSNEVFTTYASAQARADYLTDVTEVLHVVKMKNGIYFATCFYFDDY